ncbi:hypothetical protein B0H12DRAFT_1072922 [Mycena haematopus]|nr:hypothetical protein B0H12DRAFT_1072922 [Mycena haematopus]
MAPTITANKDLIAHFQAYLAVLGTPNSTAADFASYAAPIVQVNDKTMSVEELCALIPRETQITTERFVADAENRTLAMRLKIHILAKDLKMTEHAFYEFDEEWRIKKAMLMFAVEGQEIPIGK